jgi:predicted MFS family arabinose efflux permease
MTDLPASSPSLTVHPTLGTGLTVFFAIACGALVANIYYAQPLVALIGAETGLAVSAESWLVTAAQIGYGIGLVALVPLGDVFENRRVILLTMAANILSLIGLALLPGLFALFALTLVVGMTSTAAQMLVPLAAGMAPVEKRGAIVGNVTSGLIAGILLARPVAGFLAEYIGWRGVYGTSAVLMTSLLAAGLILFPQRRPTQSKPYGALIASLGHLFVHETVLRRRALFHAAIFASFSMFWTGTPLILFAQGYSPTGVALFSLSGVLGILAAPVAGRLADRGHGRNATIGAMLMVMAGFALAGFEAIAGFVAAGILIDLGVQANLVVGQREIFSLDASIRNRLNAVYMATFFVGGAVGSALTSPVLHSFGWPGICLLGIGFPALALVYLLAGERRG